VVSREAMPRGHQAEMEVPLAVSAMRGGDSPQFSQYAVSAAAESAAANPPPFPASSSSPLASHKTFLTRSFSKPGLIFPGV